MISHWSALHYYGLTEQIPRDVFVLTTTDAWVPRPRKDERERAEGGFVVGDTTYRFIQVKLDRFFGGEKVGSAKPACPSRTWSARCWTDSPCPSTVGDSGRHSTPSKSQCLD